MAARPVGLVAARRRAAPQERDYWAELAQLAALAALAAVAALVAVGVVAAV